MNGAIDFLIDPDAFDNFSHSRTSISLLLNRCAFWSIFIFYTIEIIEMDLDFRKLKHSRCNNRDKFDLKAT